MNEANGGHIEFYLNYHLNAVYNAFNFWRKFTCGTCFHRPGRCLKRKERLRKTVEPINKQVSERKNEVEAKKETISRYFKTNQYLLYCTLFWTLWDDPTNRWIQRRCWVLNYLSKITPSSHKMLVNIVHIWIHANKFPFLPMQNSTMNEWTNNSCSTPLPCNTIL